MRAGRIEHLARGQIDGGISPGCRKMEHLARGQIDGGISPGGRKNGASYARGR